MVACILHAGPLLKTCIGLVKAKVQGRLGLTAIPWQHRWESDVPSGRSLCVTWTANTGSLGNRHAPFNFTGHPHRTSLSLSLTNTHTHTHGNTHPWRPLLPQLLLPGLAGHPDSRSLWLRKPESLCFVRIIETGPPETKETLNCYPLVHLKDHLIEPLCFSLLFSSLLYSFCHTFSFTLFFLFHLSLLGHWVGQCLYAANCQ